MATQNNSQKRILPNSTQGSKQPHVVALDELTFLRKFIRHLAGSLEDIVGLHEATGYMMTVAQRLGEQLNETYKQRLKLKQLNRKQVIAAIVDLETRIKGNFNVHYEDDEKVIFNTCACPFGKEIVDRPSLCMMTSSMLGVIAAENLGYAKVAIEESISQGSSTCRLIIYLQQTEEANAIEGREFYRS